jgi:acyl carrier protein
MVSCDVSDRDALAELLASIPAAHPLTGVVHAAGVAPGATIASLTPEHVGQVFGAKVDAAWHLHELTRAADPPLFVLFSSMAATIGVPGLAHYAAANAFLDALARHRRSQGLPATSIAWGLWAQTSEMTRELGRQELARIAREGFGALSTSDALSCFDAVYGSDTPHVCATRLERRSAHADELTATATEFANVRTPQAAEVRAGAHRTSAQRLAALEPAQRGPAVLNLVRTHLATVLGHSSIDRVPPTSTFHDLGCDSLTAVELRNRLNSATGLRLPPTLIFELPTVAGLAEYIAAELGDEVTPTTSAAEALAELDRVQSTLASLSAEQARQLVPRLAAILAGLRGQAVRESEPEATASDLDSASVEDLLKLIDAEFGSL